MFYFMKYFQEDFKIYLVIGLLSIWSLSSTYIALTKEDKTLLLQTDEFETKLINPDNHNPIEMENFFHNFVGLFYTYNTQNYENHMNRVVPVIDLEVLRQFEARINSMYDKLQKEQTSQFSFITKLKKIKNLQYEVTMKVQRREGEIERENSYTLMTEIARVKRSIENPYGLKIKSLRETYE